MRTDLDSPSARAYPPQADKNPFLSVKSVPSVFHPAALVELNRAAKL
jgi:hypothetical protein